MLQNKKTFCNIEKSRINTDFFPMLQNKKLFLGQRFRNGKVECIMNEYDHCQLTANDAKEVLKEG
jgi:hypothetical protein